MAQRLGEDTEGSSCLIHLRRITELVQTSVCSWTNVSNELTRGLSVSLGVLGAVVTSGIRQLCVRWRLGAGGGRVWHLLELTAGVGVPA